MISYSEREVFSVDEMVLMERAQDLVYIADDVRSELRCHELARAIGTVLGLEVADGWYGMIEHSWLWTTRPVRLVDDRPNIFQPPNILDVYTVGRVPQVQLVHSSSVLPYEYRRGDPRADIREDVIKKLVQRFKVAVSP